MSAKLKIGGYAYTVGPAGMLQLIAKASEERGYQTVLLQENKQGVVAAEKEKMADCSPLFPDNKIIYVPGTKNPEYEPRAFFIHRAVFFFILNQLYLKYTQGLLV